MSHDLFTFYDDMNGAAISEDGVYRYSLWRLWDLRKPVLTFIMLNPSKADANQDDPTIRRCISLANSWGYGGIVVNNLFALRATLPMELYHHADPVGPDNDMNIRFIITDICFAWGNHGNFMDRDKAIIERYPNAFCIGVNANGSPKHPLYVPGSSKLFSYTAKRNSK